MPYQSQRVAYAYFLAATLLFGLQVAFGFLSLAKYLGPDPLLNVMHFATSKAIHTNLLLVWVLTGFMGATYYLVPEESQTEIYSVRLAYVQLALWLAIGVAAVVGYLFGVTAGRKLLEMPQPLKYGVVVMVIFLFNVLMTIRQTGRWTTTQGVLIGGLASSALLFISGMIPFDNYTLDRFYRWKNGYTSLWG
jgi:nitric oxide reductase subunit B